MEMDEKWPQVGEKVELVQRWNLVQAMCSQKNGCNNS